MVEPSFVGLQLPASLGHLYRASPGMESHLFKRCTPGQMAEPFATWSSTKAVSVVETFAGGVPALHAGNVGLSCWMKEKQNAKLPINQIC